MSLMLIVASMFVIVSTVAETIFLHSGAVINEMQKLFFCKECQRPENGRRIHRRHLALHIKKGKGTMNVFVDCLQNQQTIGSNPNLRLV